MTRTEPHKSRLRDVEDISEEALIADPEYQKMVKGQPFKVMQSPALQIKKLIARQFCLKYNSDKLGMDLSIPDSDLYKAIRTKREEMLRTVLGSAGTSPVIEPPFHIQYGSNTTIGDRFYANANLRILDSVGVVIGDRVMMGPNVTIVTDTHHARDVQSRRDGVVFSKPIHIEDDCWIAAGVTIVAGVVIGKGSTIGAGAVVVKDIPPYSVACGIPARVIGAAEGPENGVMTIGLCALWLISLSTCVIFIASFYSRVILFE